MVPVYVLIIGGAMLAAFGLAFSPGTPVSSSGPAAQTVSLASSDIASSAESAAYQLLFYHQAAIAASRNIAACSNAVCELGISTEEVQDAINSIYGNLSADNGDEGFHSQTVQADGQWYVLSWLDARNEIQAKMRSNMLTMNASTSMVGVVNDDASITLLNGTAFGGLAPSDVNSGTTIRIGFK